MAKVRGGARPIEPRDHASADSERFQAARIEAVLVRARETGLASGKSGRIAGRVSPELVATAKARTGLQSDSALIEFALANLAVDDPFPDVFRASRATVDPELDLEF